MKLSTTLLALASISTITCSITDPRITTTNIDTYTIPDNAVRDDDASNLLLNEQLQQQYYPRGKTVLQARESPHHINVRAEKGEGGGMGMTADAGVGSREVGKVVLCVVGAAGVFALGLL